MPRRSPISNASRPIWPTSSGTRPSNRSASLSETAENKLIGISERQFVSLRAYCQVQLAALPPEALKLYRSRVDASARKAYEDGVAQRDRRLLLDVVDQSLASSFGDKALLALGEMAFEEGDFTAARWYWERIVPAKPRPAPAHLARLPGYARSTWQRCGRGSCWCRSSKVRSSGRKGNWRVHAVCTMPLAAGLAAAK